MDSAKPSTLDDIDNALTLADSIMLLSAIRERFGYSFQLDRVRSRLVNAIAKETASDITPIAFANLATNPAFSVYVEPVTLRTENDRVNPANLGSKYIKRYGTAAGPIPKPAKPKPFFNCETRPEYRGYDARRINADKNQTFSIVYIKPAVYPKRSVYMHIETNEPDRTIERLERNGNRIADIYRNEPERR